MAEHWRLTLRRGSKVTSSRFESLDDAIDAMERELTRSSEPQRDPARVFAREIAPVAQVAVRAEVSGPQRFMARVHGGVDLRGDGSPEAWTGRVSKRIVERRDGEGPAAALRRALSGA